MLRAVVGRPLTLVFLNNVCVINQKKSELRKKSLTLKVLYVSKIINFKSPEVIKGLIKLKICIYF